MKPNLITKMRHPDLHSRGVAYISYKHGYAREGWQAYCPLCKKKLPPEATRKKAKDSLFKIHHRKQQMQPMKTIHNDYTPAELGRVDRA
jgi:hypothetical protein